MPSHPLPGYIPRGSLTGALLSEARHSRQQSKCTRGFSGQKAASDTPRRSNRAKREREGHWSPPSRQGCSLHCLHQRPQSLLNTQMSRAHPRPTGSPEGWDWVLARLEAPHIILIQLKFETNLLPPILRGRRLRPRLTQGHKAN